MIAGLRGSLWKININKIYIDVNGVVYELNISFKSYDNLKDKKGSQIYLFVYHSITDRSQKLFGFQEEKERNWRNDCTTRTIIYDSSRTN